MNPWAVLLLPALFGIAVLLVAGIMWLWGSALGTIAGIVIKTRLQPAWMLDVWGTPFPPVDCK